jgi:hypothetical protein
MGNISFVYAQTETIKDPVNALQYGIIRIKDPNNT